MKQAGISFGLVACFLASCAPDPTITSEQSGPKLESVAPQMAAIEPRIEPIPPIPVALRGCWDAEPAPDPDEPWGPHRLVVTDKTIVESGQGLETSVAAAEYVERITATSIEGMFSAPDKFGHKTIATALILGDGGDIGPAGQLRRAEGDAGSSFYRRCKS